MILVMNKSIMICTVVFPIKDQTILLAKKMKKVGAGRWNGFGGGIEPKETIEQCAVRELKEECGLVTQEDLLEKVGIIDFYNDTECRDPQYIVHFFVCREFSGKPRETEPGKMAMPTWFRFDDLPDMQAGDKLFLEKMLSGKKLDGWIRYDNSETKKVVSFNLDERESF